MNEQTTRVSIRAIASLAILEEELGPLPSDAEQLSRMLRDAIQLRKKLRWGIQGDGRTIIACVSRKRADQLAALGRQGTPPPLGPTIEVVDLWATKGTPSLNLENGR